LIPYLIKIWKDSLWHACYRYAIFLGPSRDERKALPTRQCKRSEQDLQQRVTNENGNSLPEQASQGRSAQHEVTPVNFLSRVRIANGPGIVSQDYLSGFLCENDEEFLPHLRDRVLTSGIVFLTCVAVKVSIVQQWLGDH